jgi:hypothetical protein
VNTTLIRPNHPPIVVEEQVRQIRRVGFLDRVALHLGIALIKWGRRPAQRETRERRANRVEQQLARLAREREAERSYRLLTPLR